MNEVSGTAQVLQVELCRRHGETYGSAFVANQFLKVLFTFFSLPPTLTTSWKHAHRHLDTHLTEVYFLRRNRTVSLLTVSTAEIMILLLHS